MSAWIVNDKTIALLVEALFKYDLASRDGSRLGQHLLDENYRSVNYRYGESTLVRAYRHEGTPAALLNDPYTVYKVACCYDYQSCEHPAYRDSPAAHMIDALRGAIETQLARTEDDITSTEAFDQAPWGL
jgi:hypothetical protein